MGPQCRPQGRLFSEQVEHRENIDMESVVGGGNGGISIGVRELLKRLEKSSMQAPVEGASSKGWLGGAFPLSLQWKIFEKPVT